MYTVKHPTKHTTIKTFSKIEDARKFIAGTDFYIHYSRQAVDGFTPQSVKRHFDNLDDLLFNTEFSGLDDYNVLDDACDDDMLPMSLVPQAD